MANSLGKLGIWQRFSSLTPQLVAEVEKLGYGAVWAGGSPDGDLSFVDELLAATDHIVVATGIVNIWKDDAATVAKSYHRIVGKYPGRFLLGIGVSHPHTVPQYQKPYDKLVDYLDQLDQAEVPVDDRALAALGPRVLKLAGERSAGAHPYLTTPEHTREARKILGPDKLLAPEHKVLLETDPERARAIGRKTAGFYLRAVNYLNNFRRLGFTDEDFADGGSDRLIDAVVAWGTPDAVSARINEHLEAGASHVCVQPLDEDPLRAYRAIAEVLKP